MKASDLTSWLLMTAALGCGIGAYFLVQNFLSTEGTRLREAALQSQGPMAQVVVATRDLAPGAIVGRPTMSIGEIPQRHLSARAVLPEDFAAVENRVLSRPMSAGEPLLDDFVTGLRVERFSDLLAPGTRALSLEVSALESHAGLLLPGDYIDLFVLLPGAEGRQGKTLEGLIERVKVLAAGEHPLQSAEQPYQPLEADGAGYSLITVGLPWTDAERTLRARRVGEVVYLLRPADDEQMRFDTTGMARFGDEPAPAGYAYYSSAVPHGERRGVQKNAPVPEIAGAEEAAIEVGGQDEPLPLDLLFSQVSKDRPPTLSNPAAQAAQVKARAGEGDE